MVTGSGFPMKIGNRHRTPNAPKHSRHS